MAKWKKTANPLCTSVGLGNEALVVVDNCGVCRAIAYVLTF